MPKGEPKFTNSHWPCGRAFYCKEGRSYISTKKILGNIQSGTLPPSLDHFIIHWPWSGILFLSLPVACLCTAYYLALVLSSSWFCIPFLTVFTVDHTVSILSSFRGTRWLVIGAAKKKKKTHRNKKPIKMWEMVFLFLILFQSWQRVFQQWGLQKLPVKFTDYAKFASLFFIVKKLSPWHFKHTHLMDVI